MSDFWNDRYSEEEYIYSKEPNVFFAEQLGALPLGSIILPCEGEGRNAVFAASQGWDVKAFDSSEMGKLKAMQLASIRNVAIQYTVSDAQTFSFAKNSVDLVAFIFAHFPVDIRKHIHQKAITWLKPGGRILIEAFNPRQLENNSGGPKDISMLYTKEMLLEDFKDLHVELLETKQIQLNEGIYHHGQADIIRLVALKR